MDATTFLGLEATHNPNRWFLPVIPGLCTQAMFLWGGCALGATIEAMERTTGRPIIWATAQYLSYANPPSIMDIDVTVANEGRHLTQARAVGQVGDREILTVNAALGRRDVTDGGTWVTMPAVADPTSCAPLRSPAGDADEGMMGRLDFRSAQARNVDEVEGNPSPDGASSLWVRIPDVLDVSGAALAVLGDYVPFGLGQALGRRAGGNSLDNTLRMVDTVETEWVLLDIRVHAIAQGIGQGLVHLWAEDGTLLATASQSTILRSHEDFEIRRQRQMMQQQ